MTLKPIDMATARKILDFSGGDPSLESLAELQLEGTVALHNMIADPKVPKQKRKRARPRLRRMWLPPSWKRNCWVRSRS